MSHMRFPRKSLATALGAAFVTSMGLTPSAGYTDENPFAMQELPGGYRLAAGAEGKCGEGKCGEGKCGQPGIGEHSHVGVAKVKEAKCGEGKCGEGKCGQAGIGEHRHSDME